jgi:SulP family sulfate permease
MIELGPIFMLNQEFTPKFFSLFKEGYSFSQLIRDLTAGLIVGIVALPLAIAFAIASGVKPEQGLYTAIIAGFVIAVLGGSRAQVSGPTGAFIVVIAGIVQQYGYEGLATATLLAGVFLIAMGLLGLGALLKFVPYPLTVGFTSGIALIIFSSQIKDFFGLNIDKLPVDFIEKWKVIFTNFESINLYAFAIGTLCLVIIVYLPKINPRIPASLIAMIFATLLVYFFKFPVDTIGSRFGEVANHLPFPQLPDLSWENIQRLIKPAYTIAMLGGIESLLSAVVADGMLGTRHRSNMELIAQGVGNIVSPLFQGIPATGAIARTATNIKNGGRTPVAAMFHCTVLLLIMYCFGSLARLIPMAALSAILINVAYNMSEWHAFVRALKYPKSDVAVLLITFLLTVLIDLTIAIQVGVVLAAFLFVKGMEDAAGVVPISDETLDFIRAEIPEGIEVFEVFGPIFFSAVDRFTNSLARFEKQPKVLILFTPRVSTIDGSGLRAIQGIKEKLARDKCVLMVAGTTGQPLNAIKKVGAVDSRNLFTTLEEAMSAATAYIKSDKLG